MYISIYIILYIYMYRKTKCYTEFYWDVYPLTSCGAVPKNWMGFNTFTVSRPQNGGLLKSGDLTWCDHDENGDATHETWVFDRQTQRIEKGDLVKLGTHRQEYWIAPRKTRTLPPDQHDRLTYKKCSDCTNDDASSTSKYECSWRVDRTYDQKFQQSTKGLS